MYKCTWSTSTIDILDGHAVLGRCPPQYLLAELPLMRERQQLLAIFRGPNEVIVAFENGVTAS